MFLASTSALRRLWTGADQANVREMARAVGMGYAALVEHLYNVDLIGDADRVRLHPEH